MHCSICGKEILPSSRFCSHCGAAIAAESTWQSGQAGSPRSHGTTVRPVLIRPRSGRMVAGVCAAFARTYGWNVTLIRILLVVLTPFHLGLGFIAYVIAWILIPEEPRLLPYRSV